MKKIPFFMLMWLAVATGCTKVEQNTDSKTAKLTVPQIETQATLEAIATQTEDNAFPEAAQETKKGAIMPQKAETSIIQNAYEQVEALMTAPNNTEIPVAEAEKPTYFYDETPIGKYFAQSMKASEVLTVTPSLLEAVSVTGKEGTVITLPPASLIDDEGNPVTSPVQIELKECYNTKDILAANLTTTCNDMTLQTGGMVYINATCKGKPVHLLPTQPIMVEMPTKDKKEEMELFYGEKRPASGVMNWRVADTKKKRKNARQEKIAANGEVRKDWEKVGESIKKYEIGELELMVNLKASSDVNGKPMVSIQVKNIHPKLDKYKEIIATTLNNVAWENDDKAKASGKALYEYKQQCLIGGVMFADLKDLLNVREEIVKYKNFSFKKKIPLQAHLDKNLYYKRVGLMNNYVFDKAAWTADMKFFEANFEPVKGQTNSYYDNIIAELEANKESLMNAYTAHYAMSYLFTVNQMGWINCDRFDTNAGERTDLMVKYDNKKDTDIKLLFADDRSLLPGRDLGKMVGFGGLPTGRKAIIIATKVMNEMPYFCIKEVTTGQDRNVTLSGYRQMSMAELEKELIRLGVAS